MKTLVTLTLAFLVTFFAAAALADGPPRTVDVEMMCRATGTEIGRDACVKATEAKLAVCALSKGDCKPAAPKPVPEVLCKENPGNSGKIRKTGKQSCACDDERYHLAVDGNNWVARRCFVTTDPLLVDELQKLREALAKGLLTQDKYEDLKKEVLALADEKFVSLVAYNKAIGDITERLSKLEKGVTGLDTRVTKLEEKHSPFSVIPELGGMAVSRPTSGAFLGGTLGVRTRYNATASQWFFSVGGKVAYGDSQGNGSSYALQGQLGVGSYLTESRTTSLELGVYGQGHYADINSNLPGGITTNGRGHAVGGLAGFDWKFAGQFDLRLEGGLGSGVDNAVNPSSAFPGGPHASRHTTGFQPFGGVSLGYVFDL